MRKNKFCDSMKQQQKNSLGQMTNLHRLCHKPADEIHEIQVLVAVCNDSAPCQWDSRFLYMVGKEK